MLVQNDRLVSQLAHWLQPESSSRGLKFEPQKTHQKQTFSRSWNLTPKRRVDRYKLYGCFQKKGYPNMDGDNNGSKPYEQLDDLGGFPTPIFGSTPI